MTIDTLNESILAALKNVKILEQDLSNVLKVIAAKGDILSYDPFLINLVIFVLACFVGYYVVWSVSPALHSPLMSVTNAISSVIIVGAIMASTQISESLINFGVLGVFLASINIFGGFFITYRMLEMFKKR